MIYVKKLKSSEKLKLEAVRALPDGARLMVPCVLAGDLCVMPMARKMTARQRPDPEGMAELLARLYTRTVDSYSEGIYSFVRRGKNKKTPGMPYYQYIKGEVDSLLAGWVPGETYAPLAASARRMWEMGSARCRDTAFWSYQLLHGDLHPGNIVTYRGQYRLIDWENLRSGPKEMELAFYLCWDYMRWEDYGKDLDDLVWDLDVFQARQLIHEYERERILYCLIPLWMLIAVHGLDTGSLLFARERTQACRRFIPLYEKEIFDRRPWREEQP